jgi:hypothetical protein
VVALLVVEMDRHFPGEFDALPAFVFGRRLQGQFGQRSSYDD